MATRPNHACGNATDRTLWPGSERPAGLSDGRIRSRLADSNITSNNNNRQTTRVALTP
jgi:hypothetical protein